MAVVFRPRFKPHHPPTDAAAAKVSPEDQLVASLVALLEAGTHPSLAGEEHSKTIYAVPLLAHLRPVELPALWVATAVS